MGFLICKFKCSAVAANLEKYVDSLMSNCLEIIFSRFGPGLVD